MNEAVSYQKEGGRGSHHVRESAKIKTKVIEDNVSKQRSSDKNIVSHQIGVGTH